MAQHVSGTAGTAPSKLGAYELGQHANNTEDGSDDPLLTVMGYQEKLNSAHQEVLQGGEFSSNDHRGLSDAYYQGRFCYFQVRVQSPGSPAL